MIGAKRAIYLFLAILLLIVGFIGIFLPGLPTTPLLLLSSYFAARSSPRFHQFLLSSKLFGPILRDWQDHKGVRPHVKWQAISLVILAVAILCYTSALPGKGQIAVIALALIGVAVIWRLPTIS